MDERFAIFWAVYPKKVAKIDARKVWSRLRPDAALTETMLTALAWQCRQPGWLKDGGQYIPNAARWLRGERWDDAAEARMARRRVAPLDSTNPTEIRQAREDARRAKEHG